MNYAGRPGLRVLMADDSPEDIFLVDRAVQKSGLSRFFHAVNDGEDAIAYMRGLGQYGDRRRFLFPNILLLDLKMPKVDGFGVLRWLAAHPECKVIPTIMFSSSFLEEDVHQAYVLGANAFASKPHDLESLVVLMRDLYSFWSKCQVPAPPAGEKCA